MCPQKLAVWYRPVISALRRLRRARPQLASVTSRTATWGPSEKRAGGKEKASKMKNMKKKKRRPAVLVKYLRPSMEDAFYISPQSLSVTRVGRHGRAEAFTP